MDKRCLALGLLFLALPLTAEADRHRIGLRGAVVNDGRSSLWGAQFSAEFPLGGKKRPDCKPVLPECCKEGAPHPCDEGEAQTFSAVLETGFAHGEHEGEDLDQVTYLSGLRYSFNQTFARRVQIYLQARMGGSHDSRGEIRDQPLVALGGGLHIPLKGSHEWALSLQVDRFGLLAGSQEWYTEISVGVVWRHDR